MKDETAGEPILEFVGFRPKMYSYVKVAAAGTPQEELHEKHRAKGIQSAASKKLNHANFVAQLDNPTENYITNRRIGSTLHKVIINLLSI